MVLQNDRRLLYWMAKIFDHISDHHATLKYFVTKNGCRMHQNHFWLHFSLYEADGNFVQIMGCLNFFIILHTWLPLSIFFLLNFTKFDRVLPLWVINDCVQYDLIRVMVWRFQFAQSLACGSGDGSGGSGCGSGGSGGGGGGSGGGGGI